MSRSSVADVASRYCDALARAAVRYKLQKSRMSSSRYVHIYNRLGIRQYVVRISQHPRNPEQEAVDLEIGDYEGARYPLKSWYLGLRDIAAGIMVTEVTRIFSRMVAEEEIKRKPVNKQFQTVMQNVAKKARKGQYIPMTELDAKTRIALLEDFASRFQFKKHAFNVGDSKFIGFQQGNGKRILWVALSPFDRYTVPPGTEWQEILSFGSWKGARYMSRVRTR